MRSFCWESRGDELGGSEYLKVIQGVVAGVPPHVDLQAEKALQKLLVMAAREALIRSAHDCSEGGLAVTLAECTFGTDGIGLVADLPAARASEAWVPTSTLFSETASRVVVSVARDCVQALLERADALGVSAVEIGTTGTNRISVSINGRAALDIAVSEAEAIWDTALEKHFKQRAA